MTRDQILIQLEAIRGICDALAAALIAEGKAAPAAGGCEHPETMRKDASTLRGPRQFFCGACKQIINETTGEAVN